MKVNVQIDCTPEEARAFFGLPDLGPMQQRDKGAEELRDYMKGKAKDLGLKKVRINTAGCLDRCELGPTVVIYPEGVWYSIANKQDIDEILQTHLVEGGRVERLMLKTADKLP